MYLETLPLRGNKGRRRCDRGRLSEKRFGKSPDSGGNQPITRGAPDRGEPKMSSSGGEQGRGGRVNKLLVTPDDTVAVVDAVRLRDDDDVLTSGYLPKYPSPQGGLWRGVCERRMTRCKIRLISGRAPNICHERRRRVGLCDVYASPPPPRILRATVSVASQMGTRKLASPCGGWGEASTHT